MERAPDKMEEIMLIDLIEYEEYPDVPRELIDEFNAKLIATHSRLKGAQEAIAQSYGIIAGLTQEYHTLWTVDYDTREMSLFRSTGQGTITDAVQLGIDLVDYDAFIEKYVSEYVDVSDRERVKKETQISNIMKSIEDGSVYSVNYLRQHTDGTRSYHQMTFSMCDLLSENIQFVLGFRDINNAILKEMHDARERENLRVLSETDQMTGLFNRVCGERKSTEKIQEGVKGMLCIIDIDKFKQINDTFGHSVGDKAITGVAECLKKAFRGQDIVFRLGGDEFAVMAVNVYDEVVGERIIDRFFGNLEELRIEELNGHRITASVGAVIISGKRRTFEDYYKKADSCVYESKKKDNNAVNFYRED